MTYNRTEIMNTAWANTRDMMEQFGYARHQLRSVFCRELARAWAKVKAAAVLLARSAKSLWAEVVNLENKTRLDFHGMERLSMLHRAHREAVAREETK